MTPQPAAQLPSLTATHYFTLDVLGRTLGTFNAVSGLEAEVDVFEYSEGGVNDVVHRFPGAVRYPNLILSGGSTGELLQQWFETTRLGADRHDVTLSLRASDGTTLRSWSFADAFPIRWTGPFFTQSNGSRPSGETLELAHGGIKAASQ